MPYYPQGQKSPQKDPPPKGLTIFRSVLLCLSVLMTLYGVCRLAGYGIDWVSSRILSRELRRIAASPAPSANPAPSATAEPETRKPETNKQETRKPETAAASPAPEAVAPAVSSEKTAVQSAVLPAVNYPNGLQVSPRIRELRKKSEYIVGWLTVDALDEPVVQKDNVFFLDHDATGRRNVNGAVFMDEDILLFTRPYTFLLFGHNMKTGAMFGNLHRYEQFPYFSKNRIIRFDTLYEEGQYAVFSVATISLTPGTAGYLNLAELCSSVRKIRQKALNTLTALSVHSSILDVNEEDQLLLLITCVGDDDRRLVVAARRLREKETADRLILKIGESPS